MPESASRGGLLPEGGGSGPGGCLFPGGWCAWSGPGGQGWRGVGDVVCLVWGGGVPGLGGAWSRGGVVCLVRGMSGPGWCVPGPGGGVCSQGRGYPSMH